MSFYQNDITTCVSSGANLGSTGYGHMLQQDLFIRLSKFINIPWAKRQQKPLLQIRFPHSFGVLIPDIKTLFCIITDTFNFLHQAHFC